MKKILLLFSAVWWLTASALAATSPVKATGCILSVNDRLLLVQDTATKKWALPAGYIHPDEAPETAAQRETWEETGIQVSVLTPLSSTGADVSLLFANP